mmetsp:Transcript_49480/g.143906  ORF Transcript_49480/g.143906 Transcript_49480/m.143906 type:complete len:211 (-) Transcript_49480:67-699(-)
MGLEADVSQSFGEVLVAHWPADDAGELAQLPVDLYEPHPRAPARHFRQVTQADPRASRGCMGSSDVTRQCAHRRCAPAGVHLRVAPTVQILPQGLDHPFRGRDVAVQILRQGWVDQQGLVLELLDDGADVHGSAGAGVALCAEDNAADAQRSRCVLALGVHPGMLVAQGLDTLKQLRFPLANGARKLRLKLRYVLHCSRHAPLQGDAFVF